MDTFILAEWPIQPLDSPITDTMHVVHLNEARSVLCEEHLPFTVKISRLRLYGTDKYNIHRDELIIWCEEQWGPRAIGGILNPDEAIYCYKEPRSYRTDTAKVTFDTGSLWMNINQVWRFKHEVHAAAFKLRAV